MEVYKKIIKNPKKVNFVVTGAMTNLAVLIKAFPNILQNLSGITIMEVLLDWGIGLLLLNSIL
jgi:inosine-uridine nucleoside N-ribohydrolase